MRAMSLGRPGPAETSPLRARRSAAAPAERGEVVLEVEACGVCRTDLHIVEGEVPARLPVVPGHQAAGRVVAVGEGVEGFAPGDPVGVGWVAVDLRRVPVLPLANGRISVPRARVHRARTATAATRSGMAADARWVYRLPEGFSAREAAPLLCAGIIGYRALRLSEIRPGGRLGLFGFGASAHLAIQVAPRLGLRGLRLHARGAPPRARAAHGGRLGRRHARRSGVAARCRGDVRAGGRGRACGARAPGSRRDVAVNAIHMSPIPALRLRAALRRAHGPKRHELHAARRRGVPGARRKHPGPRADGALPLEEAGEALRRVKRGEVRGAAVLEI